MKCLRSMGCFGVFGIDGNGRRAGLWLRPHGRHMAPHPSVRRTGRIVFA